MNIKHIFFYLLLSFVIFSCNNKADNILSEEEFINLMIDIHKTDAVLSDKGLFDKNFENLDSNSYYNYIFKKHNINRQDFEDNILYYSENLEEFKKIYDKIIKILTSQKADIDSLLIVTD